MRSKQSLLLGILIGAAILLMNIPPDRLDYGVKEFKENLFLISIGAIIFIYLLSILIFNSTLSISVNLFDILIGILSVYNLVYFLLNKHQESRNIVLYLSLFVFYIISRIILQHISNWKCVFWGLFICCLTNLACQLIIGIFQLINVMNVYNDFFKITGTFEDPGLYSIFLCTNYVFILIFSKLMLKGKMRRFVIVSVTIFTLPILFYVFSRATILALLVFVIIYLFNQYSLYLFRKNWITKKLAYICILGIFFTTFIFLYFLNKDSSDGRILILKITVNFLKEHFISGVGYNRFAIHYNLYQAKYFEQNPNLIATQGYLADYTKYTLNDYLQIFCEQGIIGIVCFTMLFVGIFKICIPHINKINSACTQLREKIIICSFFSIIIILVTALFSFPLENIHISALLFTFIAVITSFAKPRIVGILHFKASNIRNRLKAFFILSLICYTVLHIAFKSHFFLTNIENEIKKPITRSNIFAFHTSSEYYVINRSEFVMANAKSDTAILYIQQLLKNSSHWMLYVNIAQIYREKGDYKNAEKYLLVAHNMVPHLVTPKFLLAKVYYECGKQNKWIQMASRVLNDKEKIPSPTVESMKMQIWGMLQE